MLNKARTRGTRDKWVTAQAEIDRLVDAQVFAGGSGCGSRLAGR